MAVIFEWRGLDDLLSNIKDTIRYANGPEIKTTVYQPAGLGFQQALLQNAPEARASARVPEQEVTPVRDAIRFEAGPAEIPNVRVLVDATQAPEANAIEYGTGERYTRAGQFRGSMPAHPYFRPTIRVEKPNVVEAVGNGWLKEMTDASHFPGTKNL